MLIEVPCARGLPSRQACWCKRASMVEMDGSFALVFGAGVSVDAGASTFQLGFAKKEIPRPFSSLFRPIWFEFCPALYTTSNPYESYIKQITFFCFLQVLDQEQVLFFE